MSFYSGSTQAMVPYTSVMHRSYADDIIQCQLLDKEPYTDTKRIGGAFDPAIDVWQKLRAIIPANVNFWIAGGAFASLIRNKQYNDRAKPEDCKVCGVNDWDVFSDTPYLVIDAIRSYVKSRAADSVYFQDVDYVDETFTNGHIVNFSIPGIIDTVQVVKRPFDSPAATIDQFDFTFCMFALSGTELTYTKRALWDAEGKLVRPRHITYPLNTFKRMTKYAARGYNIHQATFIEVTKAILALEVDGDSLTDNMFYLEHHPK